MLQLCIQYCINILPNYFSGLTTGMCSQNKICKLECKDACIVCNKILCLIKAHIQPAVGMHLVIQNHFAIMCAFLIYALVCFYTFVCKISTLNRQK